MLIAIIPIVVLIVGLLMWVLATNAVVKEAGRIMFFCGMLVTTFVAARVTWRLAMSDIVPGPAFALAADVTQAQG